MTMNSPKKGLSSLVATGVIILMLILSQPASSLMVSLNGPTEGTANQTVTLNGIITINSALSEWANISSVKLNVSKSSQRDTITIPINLTSGSVVVDSQTLPNTNSQIVNITVDKATNAKYGYGYGYGYNTGSSYDTKGWAYGYGYGYGYGNYSGNIGYNMAGSPYNATIAYNINWKPLSSGTYIFTLIVTVKDRSGSDKEFSNQHTISVESQQESTISSSGGVGGGGISTRPPLEAPSEIYVSYIKTFKANEMKIIAVTSKISEDVGLTEIGATLEKSMSVSTTVSKVTSLPHGVQAPEGNLNTFFEIVFTQFGTSNKVEPTGHFKHRIAKDWLNQIGASPSDIQYLKFKDGKWIDLPSQLVERDGNYYYFQVELDSFSLFAVVAKEKVSAPSITTSTPIEKPEIPEPPKESEKEIKTPITQEDRGRPLTQFVAGGLIILGLVLAIVYMTKFRNRY